MPPTGTSSAGRSARFRRSVTDWPKAGWLPPRHMLPASFDDHEPVIASTARSSGRSGQRLVATHCQQVLAGIGFTADHPFHRFMFRATTIDRLLGSASELAPVIGRILIDRGEPIRLAEL